MADLDRDGKLQPKEGEDLYNWMNLPKLQMKDKNEKGFKTMLEDTFKFGDYDKNGKLSYTETVSLALK